MKTIQNFFTEKGNVSVKVRNTIKAETLPQVQKALASMGNVIVGSDGAFYISVGQANSTQVYARLELTISVKNPQD
jgi:hypothetical protein